MGHSNDSDDFSQRGLDGSLPNRPSAPLGKPIPPPPPRDRFGSMYVKDYAEETIQGRLDALDAAPSPQIPVLDSGIQQRLAELHQLDQADRDRLWVASRDSLDWSVLDMLPSRWHWLTHEVRFLDGRNQWHPDHMWLTDLLQEERFQEWIKRSRVWLIAVQPFLPGQPTTPILVESLVPPSPGDQLSLVSFPTFWDDTAEGKKPEAEMTMTVLWPAFRLSQTDLEAVVLGAIQDKGVFIALEESVLALAPEE